MSLTVHRRGAAEKPAIVFLHGSGVSSWMWGEQIQALESEYYCVAIDLPANGESYQSEWVSFADTADQVAAIITREVPTGKAHVVGLSLGGFVGLNMLHRHADVVESLVVSGVSAKPFSNAALWRVYLRIMANLMKRDWFINAQAKMMQIPADVLELYRRDNKRMPTVAFYRIFEEVLTFSLPEYGDYSRIRLLVAAGDSENAMIKDGLTDFVKLRNNTAAVLVPSAHHAWNAEHPQLFTDMVRAWVQERSLPRELKLIEAG